MSLLSAMAVLSVGLVVLMFGGWRFLHVYKVILNLLLRESMVF